MRRAWAGALPVLIGADERLALRVIARHGYIRIGFGGRSSAGIENSIIHLPGFNGPDYDLGPLRGLISWRNDLRRSEAG